MTFMPSRPFIYHITHVNNLPYIIKEGGLWSDADMIAQGKNQTSIGLGTIKERRLSLPVKCYPQSCVGQYVPFYFCPRSIMLFLLHRGNHPDLSYRNYPIERGRPQLFIWRPICTKPRNGQTDMKRDGPLACLMLEPGIRNFAIV